jgi:hypothetical protein
MPAQTATPTLPVLTPDQQGVFFDLIKTNAPGWLLTASSQLRCELYESLIASHGSRSELAEILKDLQAPDAFCLPLLAKALSDKVGNPVDPVGVIFQHVRSTSSLLGLRKKLVLPIDRDLLTAACENFELSETLSQNYSSTSTLYIPEKITGSVNRILPVEPHEFALLCRKLDLGKQYQTHIKSLFEPLSAVNPLSAKFVTHAKNSFEVKRHVALMTQSISVEMHQALKGVKLQQAIVLNSRTLGYQALKLFDVTIRGALRIGPVGDHDGTRCAVYLPDDPLHPLKEYASYTDFEAQLSRRLRQSEFRQHFLRYIKLSERAVFLETLNKRLASPSGSPLPPSSVYVSVSVSDLQGDPFQELFRQYSQQMLADSRLLVVPTDDEDEKSRLQRLETYESIGLNLLLFGASFVPVVGQVLLAVTALQMLVEVYEGVASWARGEQEQATDYLFDTVENLILMAAFAAGTAVAGKVFRSVRSSVFIERLRKVPGSDSRGRLWNPDLAIYQQSRRLPATLAPDNRGLQWVDGQAFLPVDNRLYAVRPKPATDLWEVLPAVGSNDTYAPLLETNDAGAWRHDSELPLEWDRIKLFRRFGYHQNDLSDTTAGQILAVCAIDDSVLRQAHVDRSHPPALLADTVQRFRADAAINAFIAQSRNPSLAAQADPDLQLRLLTAYSRWPANCRVKVVNASGRQAALYGPAGAAEGSTISIEQQVLFNGQLHASLLSAMQRSARESLLGTTSTQPATQASALARVVAEQAESHRSTLFDWVYMRTEVASDARATLLMDRFAQLPRAIAEELVRNAETAEWDALEAGDMPLRLAEEARRYLKVMHVSRAYEGLFLDATGGLATNRLVLDTLQQLPGWTDDIWLRMSEAIGATTRSAYIGLEQATEKVRIDIHPDHYSVVVDDITPSSIVRNRTRASYFEALWHGLSAQRRTALGVNTRDAGKALREKITELALARRAAIAQLVDAMPTWSGYTSPMRLADRPMPKTPMASPIRLVVNSSDNVLVSRALELHPLHCPAKIHALVNALGTNVITVLTKLEALRLEFQTIRQVLSQWVSRQTWHQQPGSPRLEVSKNAKYHTAQKIIRCWRKEPEFADSDDRLLGTLIFAPQPLGELPVITGDFSHVGRLVMNGVGASAGLNAFLHNFHNLRHLSLRGNHLTRLPLALGNMSSLEHLDLSDNQIQLTAESVTLLAGMTRLESVDLSFNPNLTRTPDVSALQRLEQLNLRATGINQWPAGASNLPQLRELDLRDNQIETVGEEVFTGNSLGNKGTHIHGNPLTADTLKKIVAHQQKTGVNLGVIASEYRRPGAYTTPQAQSSHWLVGLGEIEAQRRQTVWESLQSYPDSNSFFDVLGRLSATADYTHLYHHLSERVWNVLEAASLDDRLRRALFRQSRLARFSIDGYSSLFSEMEVQVLCYRARVSAATGVESLEQQLVTLLRGLFRLQQVEGLALADINMRPGSQSASYEHALEISLAYRVGLAERLGLPSQPRYLLSRSNVEVSAASLDTAYQRVLTVEGSSAMREWMMTQGFWTEYLESSHEEQFLAINDRVARGFAQVESQFDLSREASTGRVNTIIDNFKNERRALMRQLTAAALTRYPAPAAPSASRPPETAQ